MYIKTSFAVIMQIDSFNIQVYEVYVLAEGSKKLFSFVLGLSGINYIGGLCTLLSQIWYRIVHKNTAKVSHSFHAR